jgi:hypothetical protein
MKWLVAVAITAWVVLEGASIALVISGHELPGWICQGAAIFVGGCLWWTGRTGRKSGATT